MRQKKVRKKLNFHGKKVEKEAPLFCWQTLYTIFRASLPRLPYHVHVSEKSGKKYWRKLHRSEWRWTPLYQPRWHQNAAKAVLYPIQSCFFLAQWCCLVFRLQCIMLKAAWSSASH